MSRGRRLYVDPVKRAAKRKARREAEARGARTNPRVTRATENVKP